MPTYANGCWRPFGESPMSIGDPEGKAEKWKHFGERLSKSGDPLGPFPTISQDVPIGCVKRKNLRKKLQASRQPGEPLGLLDTMSRQV
jgi:hypothetical protein